MELLQTVSLYGIWVCCWTHVHDMIQKLDCTRVTNDPRSKNIWKRCLKLMRHLNRQYGVLPPSMILEGLVRESTSPVKGGGFAVRLLLKNIRSIIHVFPGRMFGLDAGINDVSAWKFCDISKKGRREKLYWRYINWTCIIGNEYWGYTHRR
jgi:hypothetical protein